MTPDSDSPPVAPPKGARRTGFDRMYATQPDRFAGPPSRFAAWAAGVVSDERLAGGRWVDLGCGLGRDARHFAGFGFEVLAVDFSTVAVGRATADPTNPAGLRFEANDALSALRRLGTGSWDVVYAHALYMLLAEEELRGVLVEVGRVLRPGGLHLFAVRATTDPHATAARDATAPGPFLATEPSTCRAAPTYRYFDAARIDAVTAGARTTRLRAEHLPDRHFWYVADRRAVPERP